jgi:hypothetical protein
MWKTIFVVGVLRLGSIFFFVPTCMFVVLDLVKCSNREPGALAGTCPWPLTSMLLENIGIVLPLCIMSGIFISVVTSLTRDRTNRHGKKNDGPCANSDDSLP